MFVETQGSGAIQVLLRRTMGYFALLFTLVFGSLRCYCQTAQPTVIPGTSLTVKSEEVSLNILVHDKKQRSILDLKPEEVVITDNEDPVKLTSLRLMDQGSQKDHFITLVFDDLGANLKKNAAEVAGKIIKAAPESEFSFAVMKVEPGRIGLLQGFTFDRNTLDQAVSAALEPKTSSTANAREKDAEDHLLAVTNTGKDSSGKSVAAKDRELAKALIAVLQDSARTVQEQHTQSYLSELLALVSSEQKMAGRKVVIYFTQGTYTDSSGKEVLRSIVSAANRADISIYTIDLTAFSRAGVGMDSPSDLTSDLIGRGGSGFSSRPAHAPNPSPPTSGEDFSTRALMSGNLATTFRDHSPAQELADGTGGLYIGSTHNLQKTLQRMMQDMTTYYEASYVPAFDKYDGKFRSIAVKPLRKGVKIKAREGYFALPPDSPFGIQPFELPLLNILSQTQLPKDLAFRTAIFRLGDLPGEDANSLAIEVPLSGVEIKQDINTNLYSAQVSILAQIKDKAGTIIEKFSEDIPRRGALDQIEKARSQVVTLQRHFDASPGEYVLEAAILDRTSGKAGARQIAFQIPDISGALSLSDMILIRQIEPFQAETDPREPLWNGIGRVTPNLAGEHTREMKNASVFFITTQTLIRRNPPLSIFNCLKTTRCLNMCRRHLHKSRGKRLLHMSQLFRLHRLPTAPIK